ncbi:MAG: hypothetical protein ACI8YQ_004358 [Polaribacter sp.]
MGLVGRLHTFSSSPQIKPPKKIQNKKPIKMTIRLLTLLLLTILLSNPLIAQNDNPTHQVLLLGNICDAASDQEFLNQIETTLQKIETPFTLLLNGDLTKDPLSSEEGKNQLQQLESVIQMVEGIPNGKVILYAGDRDWKDSNHGGQKQFNKLEKKIKKFIKKGKYKKAIWADDEGCPGPETFELDESLLLIVANSQWFNHPFDKPRAEDGICKIITEEDFAEELESEVKENLNKNIIIAGHHPFESLGNYGGFFSVKDHFSPFPIAGSFRTAYRKNIGTVRDISNHHLHEYREVMRNISYFYDNLIFVSGHEQNQQIIQDGKNYLINSGAPISGKYAAQRYDALMSSRKVGIILLKYFDSGKVVSELLQRQKTDFAKAEEQLLFNSVCEEDPNSDVAIPLNYSHIPCFDKEVKAEKMQQKYGNVNRLADMKYKAGPWKRAWLGRHYRTTWTQTINVPTLHLDTTFGGLNIYKKGGGRQTTSLKFKAMDGTHYTFRSVNKDPSKAFNYKLRPTFITAYFRDQISSQHPYGAMAVASLLDEIGILHATPKLYVLPDDPRLGGFQRDYGNLLGMLEEHPSKPNNAGEVFGGGDDIYQSNKLFKELFESRRNHLNEKEFIKARTFDILIGDWSKHEDNWKWAVYKEEDGKYFRPIPRDRDHAFPLHGGVLPWMASREWAGKVLETFEHKIKGLRSVMYQAIHLDRFLATSATREDWIAVAKEIQVEISEAEIDAAVEKMPAETYEEAGKAIASKLKSRLKDLDKYAEEYYEMLNKYVDVVGSDEEEYFEISHQENGRITIKMFDTHKNKKGDRLFYERTFIPKETKEIRIFGLGDDDIFDIMGEGKSSIKVRLIGGSGDDSFLDNNLATKRKTLIYDKGNETNYDLTNGSKIVNHWNKDVYEYDRTSFDYHDYFPILGISYNNFNGLSLKLGATITRQKFGKKGYASEHAIYGSASTEGNKRLNYSGRFHHALKRWDVPFELDYSSPEFRNNFYGLGNDTPIDQGLEDDNFYKFFHKTYHIKTGVSRTFWQKSNFELLTGFAHSDFKELDNSILKGDTSLFGANVGLSEIPVEAKLTINLLDKDGFPYDGLLWTSSYKLGTIIEGTPETETYGIARSTLAYFISTKNNDPITLGLRAGAAVTHGKTPFYHLPNLGSETGLRGFTGERFTGESSLFFNSELRWQLFKKNTRVVPVKFGLKAFFDLGKVNILNEDANSSNWHYGYGGGIFLVPFDELLSISLLVGFSEEESFFPVLSLGRAF